MKAHQNKEDCLTDEEVALLLSPDTEAKTLIALINRVSACVYCQRKFVLSFDSNLLTKR